MRYFIFPQCGAMQGFNNGHFNAPQYKYSFHKKIGLRLALIIVDAY